MNKAFFDELTRVLAEQDIQTGTPEHDTLPVLLWGCPACRVQANGTMCIGSGDLRTSKAEELYQKVAPFSEMVYEYTSQLKRAPLIISDTANDDYRLLSEFNGVILAGKEMDGYGYQFATWQRDGRGTGFCQGNYFLNNYSAAKEDFALRSGLIEKGRQFTDEQLTELYRCTQDVLEGYFEMTDAQRELIATTAKQIEDAVPNLHQRVLAANTEYEMTQQNM